MNITKKNVNHNQPTSEVISPVKQTPISMRDIMSNDGLAKLSVIQSTSYEVIDLPSKGWTYPDSSTLSSGRIRLKLPTGRQESILSSPNLIEKGIMLDEFLRALILDPVQVQDLLSGDKLYAIFAARRLAYGDAYHASIKCENCHKQINVNFDLSKIPLKDTPELFECDRDQSEFNFVLPLSQKSVKFQLNTGYLENLMEKRIAASKIPNIDILIRVASLVTEISGKTQFSQILSELTNVPARDTLALRTEINKYSPDMITKQTVTCKHCLTEQEVSIPWQVQLFWPSNDFIV